MIHALSSEEMPGCATPKKRFTQMELGVRPKNLAGQVLRILKRRFARAKFNRERKVPIAQLSELLPEISRSWACVRAATRGPAAHGNVSLQELVILSSACRLLAPRVVFEFGTFDGLTTLHFAMNSPAETRVFTLDLDPEDPVRKLQTDDTYYTKGVQVGAQFEKSEFTVKITQFFANSLSFDVATFAAKADLVFIDGGHDYKVVSSDSRKALEMLSPGGIVFWHDYSFVHEGVYTFLNELSTTISLAQIAGTALVCHSDRLRIGKR